MMNRKLKNSIPVLFAILLSVSAPCGMYAQSFGKVSGEVVDSDSKVAQEVYIALEGTSISVVTDENGHFAIPQVPAGDAVFTLGGINYEMMQVKFNVKAGEDNIIPKITLTRNIHHLGTTVVKGKSAVRKQEEQAYAISVVDLSKSYNTSAGIGKLLNNASSVRVREQGGVGSGYSLSINGFSGNQVKIFMDGLPMDNFGSSFGIGDLPANMASRIEVYKGVLPPNLGMDALGGAVNIVTRRDANYLDASYSTGSFNTHKSSLNGAYTNLKTGFTVRANGYFNYSDNDYRVFVPILDLQTNKYVDTAWVRRFHDTYRSIGGKLEAGVVNKPFADQLLLGMLYSENDSDVQNGQTMQIPFGGITRSSRSAVPSIRYSKEDLFTEGLSLSFYGAYNNVEDRRTDTLSRRYNWLGQWVPASSSTAGENARTNARSTISEWLTTANLSYDINEHHQVMLNHSYSTLERKTRDREDPDNEIYRRPQSLDKNILNSGYMIRYDKWNATVLGKMYHLYNFSSRMVGTGDNRYVEDVSRERVYFGYGMAATYFPVPQLQIKSSYEHAYRLPQSGEIFGDGMFTRDNPDLKPEQSDNVNVAVLARLDLNSDHHLSIESGFIYRNTTGYILNELSQSGNSVDTRNVNRGKVQTLGVEGAARYMWKNTFMLGATATFQDITDREEKIYLTGFNEGWTENPNYKHRLPNVPYLFGSLDAGLRFQNVGWKGDELSVNYGLNYVQEYFLRNSGLGARDTKAIIPEQLSHDISVGYNFKDGRYNITLECRNITDSKLYDNYMLQKPGRSFMLKLRYFLR